MQGRITQSQLISASELAAERYAYVTLEHREAVMGILAAIEKDLRAGMTPESISSIWRQVSGFENMPQLVKMAARHIQRGMDG